ncbi:MAG: hypothetical protein IJL64_06270 [Bacteroidales bacterium]|nr:hypothetical protein [Bacteroidales bacterium]
MLHRHFFLIRYTFPTDNVVSASQITSMLRQIPSDMQPIRLVVFGPAGDNAAHKAHRSVVGHAVETFYGAAAPLYSYVAQPSLFCPLLMEVHAADVSVSLQHKQLAGTPYITFEDSCGKQLFMGNLFHADPSAPVGLQAAGCFRQAGEILQAEQMPVDSIVRQWNYIERITGYDGDIQRYQAFNDARSAFYAPAVWPTGYPAATGIGTRAGGIQIDIEAMTSYNSECQPIPIDNRMQTAAHAYSGQVLQNGGQVRRTTPKFERAKLLWTNTEKAVLALSGTAAIRGEQSKGTLNARQQTEITLEHILHLAGRAVETGRISPEKDPYGLQMLRIYVKHMADAEGVKATVEAQCPGIPCAFVQADICRQELLVEIEGWGLFTTRSRLCGRAAACQD